MSYTAGWLALLALLAGSQEEPQIVDGIAAQAGSSVITLSELNRFVETKNARRPVSTREEAQKLRDRARRTIYEMAARECDLLRDVLAKDCRMESLTSNINRQPGLQQQEGFNVNGSMSLQITLK